MQIVRYLHFFGMLLHVSSHKWLLEIWMNTDFSFSGISPLLQSAVQITCMKGFICKLGYLCVYMCLHVHIHTHMHVIYIYIYIYLPLLYYYLWVQRGFWNIYFRLMLKLYMSEKVWAKLAVPYLLACIHCTLLLVFN